MNKKVLKDTTQNNPVELLDEYDSNRIEIDPRSKREREMDEWIYGDGNEDGIRKRMMIVLRKGFGSIPKETLKKMGIKLNDNNE